MPTTVTSATLLEGMQREGNEEAWCRFCSRYEPMLRAVVRRSGFPEQDAGDVVQSTLLTFLEGFREGKYDPGRGRLRTWLWGIVLNKIREARRRLAKREIQITDDTATTAFFNKIPDDHELSDTFEQEWERAVMAECIQELRLQVEETTFQSFVLFVLKGWPAADVAQHLGISREAVYTNKRRAVARLRQLSEEISGIW